MSDYIKLEAVEKVLETTLKVLQGFEEPITLSLADIQRSDFVEVVRCKDCKWHTSDDECTHPQWDCEERTDYPIAMDFDYFKHGERG